MIPTGIRMEAARIITVSSEIPSTTVYRELLQNMLIYQMRGIHMYFCPMTTCWYVWGQADASGIADYFGLHKKNGLCTDKYGDWHYYEDGEVSDYTGMAVNEYGWWYVTDGEIDDSYTGIAENEYGRWYMQDGVVNMDYTGMLCDGAEWYYVQGGYVNDAYTGMACNEYGWWYFEDGKLNWNYTGMALNEYGWWYFENGLLNEEYTGIGANSYGEWYYQQGRIGYDFSGKVKFDDTEYTITEGYVVEKRIVNETEADTADTVHTAGTLPAGEESSTLGKQA